MAKPSAPIITDPSAFIRGAIDTPAPVTIGDKTGQIQPPPQKSEAVPIAPEAPAAEAALVRKAEPKPKPQAPRLPWDDANPKIRNFVQLRVPEPLGLKLKWIKDNSLGVPSVHDLILKTLEEMAIRRIAEIQRKQGSHESQ